MEASDEWVVIEPSDSDLTLDNLPDEVTCPEKKISLTYF